MAEIKLYPRKEFEIILEDGTVIKGQFGTWALKRFCDKQGLTLQSAAERLGNPGIGDIIEYILSAVEYACRKVPKEFPYNDVDCCSWIDELGGIQSENFVKLFKHSGDEAPATEEKKTDS
jgi:hypothetical protein